MVFRFVLGFAVPRRATIQNRSEEFLRATLLSLVASVLALVWAKHFGHFNRQFSSDSLATCFAGIYSEQFFREHTLTWFTSASRMGSVCLLLLWRLYSIVVAAALTVSFILKNYAWCRERLWVPARPLMASLFLPRIAPWHILLSTTLLNSDQQLHLDVLTKADLLYQGRLQDKMLSSEGNLISISLVEPRRFDRQAYLNAKNGQANPEREKFWKDIPTEIFVIMASEIQTLNLRYAPKNIAALKRIKRTEHLLRALESLARATDEQDV